eukprot:scaffold502166_cov18-Prasinocladus_malaysianus.AAC.1
MDLPLSVHIFYPLSSRLARRRILNLWALVILTAGYNGLLKRHARQLNSATSARTGYRTVAQWFAADCNSYEYEYDTTRRSTCTRTGRNGHGDTSTHTRTVPTSRSANNPNMRHDDLLTRDASTRTRTM